MIEIFVTNKAQTNPNPTASTSHMFPCAPLPLACAFYGHGRDVTHLASLGGQPILETSSFNKSTTTTASLL